MHIHAGSPGFASRNPEDSFKMIRKIPGALHQAIGAIVAGVCAY
jgi:hypothetical protein